MFDAVVVVAAAAAAEAELDPTASTTSYVRQCLKRNMRNPVHATLPAAWPAPRSTTSSCTRRWTPKA